MSEDCGCGPAIRALASVECIDTDAGYCDVLSIDEAVLLYEGMAKLGYVIVPTGWAKEASANANP